MDLIEVSCKNPIFLCSEEDQDLNSGMSSSSLCNNYSDLIEVQEVIKP